MLVLTRKLGETITIADDIRITILACTENEVKLGIEAPAEVAVHRAEVYAQINSKNQRAAVTDTGDAAVL